MLKPTVRLFPGVIAIYGASIDASIHKHIAMQIIWPLENTNCVLNSKNIDGVSIINSMVEHQLEMTSGWVLLIEPKSLLGQSLSEILDCNSIKTLSTAITHCLKKPNQIEDITCLFSILFSELKLPKELSSFNKPTVHDKRIQQLLDELDQCLHVDCMKPANWRANEVANQLSLSESRFLHLFRQELDIAWRPYLLWRRIICAVQAMMNNTSATDAAHLAGFSDSAHLSRTFKNNFGMTISQAHSLFGKK